jgi:hypothetical protein
LDENMDVKTTLWGVAVVFEFQTMVVRVDLGGVF